MASIREVKDRISSVVSTKKITQAMKMVAAAKLYKAQTQAQQLRPYAEKLTATLANTLANTDQPIGKIYTEKRKIKKLLLLVITSDRGLCGSFNANVCRKAIAHIKALDNVAPEQVHLLPIGKKGLAYFQKHSFPLIKDYTTLFSHLNYAHVKEVAEFILNAFQEKQYDEVALIYNAFKNVATQITKIEPFLPLRTPPKEAKQKINRDYLYEPSHHEVLEALIPQVLKIQLYKALLESNAAEHGARMTAMSKSTDNANELLKELRLTYNRTRQAAITSEITEIVAGAAAL